MCSRKTFILGKKIFYGPIKLVKRAGSCLNSTYLGIIIWQSLHNRNTQILRFAGTFQNENTEKKVKNIQRLL